MLLHSLLDSTDDSQCILTFEQPQQWLRATWCGYVDPLEALRGAERYLDHVGALRCAYLLNDNTELQGPWFDSVAWLEKAWLPHAVRLGLRYVAHVVQVDTGVDILTLSVPQHVTGQVELQLFHQVSEAEEWLRHCQSLSMTP